MGDLYPVLLIKEIRLLYVFFFLISSKVDEFFFHVYSRIFKNYLPLGSLILMLPLAFSFMLRQTTVNFSLMG